MLPPPNYVSVELFNRRAKSGLNTSYILPQKELFSIISSSCNNEVIYWLSGETGDQKKSLLNMDSITQRHI